jgi:thymidylate synthase (FAD)
MKVENVLGDGIGFIELVDSMGTDLTIANAARVSFGKRKTQLDESDKKLIKFLAKHKHWSPFRHIQFQFHVKAPEIVGRQFYKHIVGSSYAFPDTAWNEVSGRYVVYDDTEYYVPKEFRKQSKDNKQASTDELVDHQDVLIADWKKHWRQSYDLYESFIKAGVAKEQARGLLPVSFYTEWYWSASLQAVWNFIDLRVTSSSQWEIRKYGEAMSDIALTVAPFGVQALLNKDEELMLTREENEEFRRLLQLVLPSLGESELTEQIRKVVKL